MKRFIVLTGCLIVFLSACGGNPGPIPTPPAAVTPTAAATDEDVHQEPVVFPTGPYDNLFPQPEGQNTVFTLTDTQQALFDAYSKNFNFDISIFKNTDPIDIAQVFIECGIEGLWEGEYNMCVNWPISKAEYRDEALADVAANDIRTRRDKANYVFPYLKDGTFVDGGNGLGYIEFNSYDSSSNYSTVYAVKAKLHLQQVNGIWMIDQTNFFEYEQ